MLNGLPELSAKEICGAHLWCERTVWGKSEVLRPPDHRPTLQPPAGAEGSSPGEEPREKTRIQDGDRTDKKQRAGERMREERDRDGGCRRVR